ncbi:MAG: hypothetical protein MUC55_02215 [Burkholderiales bacterium]|jgi:hypothetical protein|nr:hypothetical protein [Burkholderiales bacterium]
MDRPTSGFRLTEIVRLPRRSVHVLEGASPAVFLLVDDRAGAILVNVPPFSETALSEIRRRANPTFIFLPSRFGARDLELWRAATGARTIASAEEVPAIEGRIDEPIDGGVRMHGRLDFLLLSGRTRGSCALRVKEPPGIVFFGPALEHAGVSGFVLRAHPDDYSFENRLIGALGFRDLEFEFAFCDDYIQHEGGGGPGAGSEVRSAVGAALERSD